jgi:hypothetical protein
VICENRAFSCKFVHWGQEVLLTRLRGERGFVLRRRAVVEGERERGRKGLNTRVNEPSASCIGAPSLKQ